MDPEQQEAFIYSLGHDPATGYLEDDDRYSRITALMVREALRPSEAAAVKLDWCSLPPTGWGELVLERALVSVVAGWSDGGEAYEDNPLKWTDRSDKPDTREVPLTPETVADLRRHIARYGVASDGRISSAREGGPVNPTLLSRIISKARDRTFADPNSPHFIGRTSHPLRQMSAYHCRHSEASVMLNSGIKPQLVADRLGHDLPVLLKIYASVIEDDKSKANDQMDRYRAEYLSRSERGSEAKRTLAA